MENSKVIKPRFIAPAALLTNPEGKIFLVGKKGKLTIPTGKMETGDKNPSEALKRELSEEIKYKKTGAGIRVTIMGSLGNIIYDKESPEAAVFEIIRCTVDESDLAFSEGGETFSIWVDLDVVPRLEKSDRLAKDAVSLYLDYLNKHLISAVRKNGGENEEGAAFCDEEEMESQSC